MYFRFLFKFSRHRSLQPIQSTWARNSKFFAQSFLSLHPWSKYKIHIDVGHNFMLRGNLKFCFLQNFLISSLQFQAAFHTVFWHDPVIIFSSFSWLEILVSANLAFCFDLPTILIPRATSVQSASISKFELLSLMARLLSFRYGIRRVRRDFEP